MFESDEKKYLKRKYQGLGDRMGSPKSQQKQRQPSQQAAREHEVSLPQLSPKPGTASSAFSTTGPKTVYGELKLSEQLSFQLDTLK